MARRANRGQLPGAYPPRLVIYPALRSRLVAPFGGIDIGKVIAAMTLVSAFDPKRTLDPAADFAPVFVICAAKPPLEVCLLSTDYEPVDCHEQWQQ